MPEIRFLMAHGQMRGVELERVMWDFFQRKADVLVASSIIESGLDIPTVNTMLIEDAQDFGLAQLYQLRGRIGRERQRAYCYLFYPSGHAGGTHLAAQSDLEHLPEESRLRLQALREFSDLGSGMRLAMRDLEIRGAGDLLGAKQHGFINAVGVEYYSELLQEEVGRLSGRREAPKPPVVQLDLPVEAYLPEGYLPGEMERIAFYKRMLAATTEELPALRRELEDLSGPLPPPANNLFRLLDLRAMAAKAGMREIAQRGEYMEIRFRADATVSAETLARWHREYAGRLEFVRDAEGDGVRFRKGAGDALEWLKGFLA
jgi:transcription-repair coupling factor (superfamily II helicase)